MSTFSEKHENLKSKSRKSAVFRDFERYLTSMNPMGDLASSAIPLEAFSAAAREFSVSILRCVVWCGVVLECWVMLC